MVTGIRGPGTGNPGNPISCAVRRCGRSRRAWGSGRLEVFRLRLSPGDVEHDPVPAKRLFVGAPNQHRLVAYTDDPTVLRDHPIFRAERLSGPVGELAGLD